MLVICKSSFYYLVIDSQTFYMYLKQIFEGKNLYLYRVSHQIDGLRII